MICILFFRLRSRAGSCRQPHFFDVTKYTVKIMGDFSKLNGLLRITELYLVLRSILMFNRESKEIFTYVKLEKIIKKISYLSVTFARHSQIHSAKQQQQINFGNTLICIMFFRLRSHAGSCGQPHFFDLFERFFSSHYDMVLILSSRYICMTWVFSCLFFLIKKE